jgi:lipopolysaccharide export system protein LptA
VLLVLVVAAFVAAARWQVRRIQEKAEKLGIEVQSSTSGFSLSKSEGGRTLFTVQAAKAIEYKQGGRAELREVSIVLYGKDSTRFDQIYGSQFIYDPKTGEIHAKGLVEIELEGNAEGPRRPDQAPPRELRNPIHLKTSGLVFNQKTGFTATEERIEFRLPRASGSAVGATFDSKTGVLVLKSQVAVRIIGNENMLITSDNAVLTKEPHQVVLTSAKMQAPGRTLEAGKLTAALRPDNTVERLLATDQVRINVTGSSPAEVRAPQADFTLATDHQISSGVLSGGVQLESKGADGSEQAQGSAAKLRLHFAAQNRLTKVEAVEEVRFIQKQGANSRSGSDLMLIADQVDLFTTPTGTLQKAVTQGAARIELVPANAAASDEANRAASKTTISAGRFEARFAGDSQIKSLHGEPDAKIVSSRPGEPDRISTSRTLDVAFGRRTRDAAGIESVLQKGEVHMVQDKREAFAEQARYTPADETLALNGSPRVSDPGILTTAGTIRFNRPEGEALAENDVKTTYNEVEEQPQGALLGSGDPIHVTARNMTARRDSARYSGGARLWQGANIVQAQVIEFNRDKRSIQATGSSGRPVTTVLVQRDRTGKVTPVNITSLRLSYNDLDRTIRFEGGVVMKTADGTLTAQRLDAFLVARAQQARGEQPNAKPPSGASQLDHAVAQGRVDLQQPGRRAQGERLVYTAAESKYVLTGTKSRLPTLADVTHGSVTGDSLTFYSRDDRVVIGSANSQRSVTQTHAPKSQ